MGAVPCAQIRRGLLQGTISISLIPFRSLSQLSSNMPELTEVTDTKPREEDNDSGTDSDGDDSIPELEDTAAEGGAGEASSAAAAAAMGEEGVSKNKQSRG